MNKIRIILFAFIILIYSVTMVSYILFNNTFLIEQWNIPYDIWGFYDTRQFAMGAESYYQGHDPLKVNPANDRGQRLTYPRIWHVLFPLVIDQSRTNIMGTIIVIIFFTGLGIFWFSNKFDNLTYLILSVIALSPVAMLGVERSNNDLIIFFIISLALTVNYYSRISGFLLFLFAAILKFHPVFGFVYLLKEDKRRFWTLFLSGLGLFALYMLLIKDDLNYVFTAISQGVGTSYGINVWWKAIGHRRFFNMPISESTEMILQAFSYILAATIIILTLYLSVRPKNNETYKEGRYIDAFRVGSITYIGSYLLLTNNDYRLIFMIFTIPQLVEWLKDKEMGKPRAPLVTLTAMVFSLWSFVVMRILGRNTTTVMEEFANWVMFAGLLYLFLSSLPDWFKDYFRRPFSFIKNSNKH